MIHTGFTKGNPVEHWHSIDVLNAGPLPPQSSPSAQAMGTDVIAYVPLMVRDTVTVKKLWVACGATGGGTLEIGLYDAGGTRLITSGSQSHPAAATEFVYDCTDTVISRGIYYWAVVTPSASQTFYFWDIGFWYRDALGVWTEAASSLPASATFAAGGSGQGYPIGGILTNTVVS